MKKAEKAEKPPIFYFMDEQFFSGKSGVVTFHHSSMSNTMQKFRKVLRAVFSEKCFHPPTQHSQHRHNLKLKISIYFFEEIDYQFEYHQVSDFSRAFILFGDITN